jgi:cytochrome c-type biogenesis protein CcmH/NrfF
VTLMPLFGLPVGFVLIIALLIVSTRRRRGAGDHGSAE